MPGASTSERWAGCPRVQIGDDELQSPQATIDRLQLAWSGRTPVVIELGVTNEQLLAPERCNRPVHSLSPDFEFSRERLHFLIWANNYDARSGEPIWWHGRKAARRGADQGLIEGTTSDLVGGNGAPLFVDGGPSQPPDLGPGIHIVHRWNAERGIFAPARHDEARSGLADDQRAAVAHREGPARVIAPAGSGKTRVLTERLRHLVLDRGIDPQSITVLAYNTKAADELRRRCDDFLGTPNSTIRTLNSLGLSICNRPGGGTRRTVLDEPQVRALVQQVIDVPRQSNTDTVAPYMAALSAIRLGLRDPSHIESEYPDAAGIGGGFNRYRQALADAGALDFDEQIYGAIEVLLQQPEIRAEAQRRCRYLLVDEFQDLTPAHVLLLRLLSAPGYDCFAVGDDDQVIYGYSGADPGFLLNFGRYFPGATKHALEVNYRCPAGVVDGAVHLLAYNRTRIPKVIRTTTGAASGGLQVRRLAADQLAAEAVTIVQAWQHDGSTLDDIAVLSRVNSALLPVQVACTEAGIPCSAPLDGRVLERTGVRTALAYLRMGLDPTALSTADIRDTIRRPSRSIAPRVTELLTGGRRSSLADIRRLAGRLSGRDVTKLQAFADDIERLSEVCRGTTAEALRSIRVDIGLGGTMDVLDSSRLEPDRSTHTDDLVALESVAELHPEVSTFEAWLRTNLRSVQPEGPKVLLSTVHKIKGREWENVIVFGASHGSFPHRLSHDDEGERRVFHVAITRGKRQVIVLADRVAPSIFVGELDGSRPKESPTAGPTSAPLRRTAAAAGAPSTAPTTPTAASSVPSGPAEEALRTWRRAAATAHHLPAYVILNDRELRGIAERSPRTLATLSKCPGIGSIRLERWGDEILAALESALAAD